MEHIHLVGIVNGLEHALSTGDYPALRCSFEHLGDYAQVHFMPEHEQSANLSSASNECAHQYLEKKLQRIRLELEAKGGIWSESAIEHFIRYLRDWITDYVSRKDMLQRPAPRTVQ